MAGFTLPMSRKKAVPYAVACGCDMFLFARNLEEDVRFMMDGVADGTITGQRLDEAVTRILALKAALGLHLHGKSGIRPGLRGNLRGLRGNLQDLRGNLRGLCIEQPAQTMPQAHSEVQAQHADGARLNIESAKKAIGTELHRNWAIECADRSITLVKEQPGVLPITPEKYKRILFHAIESTGGTSLYTVKEACSLVAGMLEDEGFIVDIFKPSDGMEGKTPKTTDTIGAYDLILYVANLATKSNQTVVRIEWAQPMGANCGHYINDIPTVFVSLENPYHLLDFPRVKTFVNCYSSSDITIKALIEKMCGRSAFKGVSPVDPFCGKWDARL
jgi:beta-N-acetylhexosaminidase